MKWALDAPIYRQLAGFLAEKALHGAVVEGEALPPLMEIASTYLVNPRIAARALQLLEADGLIELQPDRRWHVLPGARERLLQREREEFLVREWPALREDLRRFGLGSDDLL